MYDFVATANSIIARNSTNNLKAAYGSYINKNLRFQFYFIDSPSEIDIENVEFCVTEFIAEVWNQIEDIEYNTYLYSEKENIEELSLIFSH
jgi:hypothetical protein